MRDSVFAFFGLTFLTWEIVVRGTGRPLVIGVGLTLCNLPVFFRLDESRRGR